MTSPDGGSARRVFLSLGSNQGDRRRFLAEAVESLGPMVTAVSSVFETDPVGGPQQGLFLNLVVELRSTLTPRELLAVCHRLESGAGRVRTERWGPRTLDVDVLWRDGETVADDDLEIPHPRMWERRFVLAPLRELAPDLVGEDQVIAAVGAVRVVDGLPPSPGSR